MLTMMLFVSLCPTGSWLTLLTAVGQLTFSRLIAISHRRMKE